MILRYLMLVLFWVMIALACHCPYLYAQTGLTKVEGISQGMVTCLLQDREGFIWSGTLDGLNRYDGYGFKTFYHNPEDSNSIAGNTIYNLFEDSKGRIWVSMGKDGVDCYDKKSGRFIHITKHIPFLRGTNPDNLLICEANMGKIYLLSTNALYELCLDELVGQEQFSGWRISSKEIISGTKVANSPFFNQIIAYQDRVLAIMVNNKPGLFSLATRHWLKTDLAPPLDGHVVNSLYCDTAQNTSLYIKNNTLYSARNGQLLIKVPFEVPSSDDFYCHIIKGGEGNIYISLPSKGIFRVSTHIPATPPILLVEKPLESTITAFIVDKQGRIWMGTNGYGLYAYLPQNKGITKIIGGSINYIESIEAQILVRSSDQLMELKDGGLHPCISNTPNGNMLLLKKLPSGNLIAIRYKKDGGVDNYLIEIITSKGELLKSVPYFTHDYPKDVRILVDRGGQVWLSLTDGQIARINKGLDSLQVVDFSNVFPQSPKSTAIMSIYESADNVIWLPTNQGLVKMDNPSANRPSFRLFQNQPKDGKTISSNAVLSVVDDPSQPNSFLWVTTRGGGLNKMDKETGLCIRFNTGQGLPNKVVYGVLTDALGRIWVSTNNGISCFDPQKLYFHNFTLIDGLQNNEFNTNAFYKHPDGRLFFGGVKGINIIQPNLITFDSTFYPVFFTTLKVNNSIINPRDKTGILGNTIEKTRDIHLAHDQNFLTISFTATDFSKLGYNNYRYQMEGVDKGWNYGNTQNEVSYPNLAPGNYRLRVSNSNQNGDWNPSEATLVIYISPPWWQSFFAYMVYFLAFATGIFLFIRNRIDQFRLMENARMKEQEAKQLKELEELKERFFNNITHELRTPLTLVIEPARQLLMEDANKGNRKLVAIHDNAVRLLRLVGDLLDISKLEAKRMPIHWAQGDIIPILRNVFGSFQSKAGQKKIQLSFIAQNEVLVVRTDMGMVEKMAFNLLSNAIKFTEKEGRIDIAITTSENNNWTLAVTDTGIGIAEKDQPYIFDRYYQANPHPTRRKEGTGIGLALVKECAELLDGTVGLESQLGKGATFWVTLPMFPQVDGFGHIDSVASNHLTTDPFIQQAETMPPTDAFMANGENPTVLIVEDNPEMAQFIALMVADSGYNVLFAQDGAEGYEKALEAVPDIILSDWMMPNKDGLEMTVQIKANWITCHIPVILLTAKGSMEAKIEGYDKGADAYLGKPFTKEKLLVRMKQLLESRRLMQRKFNLQSEANLHAKNDLPPKDVMATLEGLDIKDQRPEKSPDDLLMEKLNAFIKENIADENLTIDGIASQIHMSRTQLFKKVTALTGETPGKYIRNIRLGHAHYLIQSNQAKSIEDVMKKVGYSNLPYFISQYKERFGLIEDFLVKK